MSAVTKKALYSTLAGGTALTNLLSTDENNDPAIFNAFLNKLESPSFPCITFRESSGSADQRFKSETVDQEIWDLEIWAKTESALVVSQIFAEVDRLLHNKTLTLETGRNYDCVRIAQNPDMYDTKLNLSFGLYRYKLVASRS